MARRKQSATVELKLRVREPLRAKLAAVAQRKGISTNAEAIARLERSFEREHLTEEFAKALIEMAAGDRGLFDKLLTEITSKEHGGDNAR